MEKLFWKQTTLFAGFAAFFALIILAPKEDALFWNSIALGGLMIFFWLFEALPIYVTALLPFIFGIPLGVIDKDGLASSFGNTTIYLFLGGFVLALALEKHDVHKQIAKRIIMLVGNSKSRLLLGFILSTSLLSMWISNTATALMMLPMALAITSSMPKQEGKSKFTLFLLLSIAYSASVGGMATIVGSPPNGSMQSILAQNYDIHISFVEWMKIGVPISIILQLILFGFFYLLMGKERHEKIHVDIEKKKWTISQLKVLFIFLLVVLMWTFKGVIVYYLNVDFEDFGPALLGAMLLFVTPSDKSKMLLDWKDTRELPWGILILFGGGLALAKMFETNGVIAEISTLFLSFKTAGIVIILLVIVAVATFATELMSNTALVAIFIPIIGQFALQSDYSIVQLCIPVTLAASCAFMLPVGTPPNAIIFSSGQVKISDMAKYGFLLNTTAVLLIVLFGYLYFS